MKMLVLHKYCSFIWPLCQCIISDILDPVLQPDPTLMNRAFWRQNITFNKPAPFGAKLSGAFHWNCSTPFLFSIRFFDPDQPFLLCI